MRLHKLLLSTFLASLTNQLGKGRTHTHDCDCDFSLFFFENQKHTHTHTAVRGECMHTFCVHSTHLSFSLTPQTILGFRHAVLVLQNRRTLARTSAALVWKGAKSERLSFVTTVRD